MSQQTVTSGDRIRVAVRVRPLSEMEMAAGVGCVLGTPAGAPSTLELADPVAVEVAAAHVNRATAARLVTRRFDFDRVYTSARQAEVYADIGCAILDTAFNGINSCVLAYGQTGSGKTYTMLGASGVLNPGVAGGSELGLIPRLCQDLFERAAALEADTHDASSECTSVTVTVSFFEVYCEAVRDLLATPSLALSPTQPQGVSPPGSRTSRFFGGNGTSSAESRSPRLATNSVSGSPQVLPSAASSGPSLLSLRVREHPRHGPYVEGLTEVPITSYHEAEQLLVAGTFQRRVGATRANESSSRSHAVFTIILRITRTDAQTGLPTSELTSKIVLVDLAGSERAESALRPVTSGGNPQNVQIGSAKLRGDGISPPSSHAEARRQREWESSRINTSLSALGAVVKALAARPAVPPGNGTSATSQGGGTTTSSTAFVPYRNSVLTWLLKDSLGGNSRTAVIATVSPASTAHSETLSTLKYAEAVKRVVTNPVTNTGLRPDDAAAVIAALRHEVATLRAQLAASATSYGERPTTATPADRTRTSSMTPWWVRAAPRVSRHQFDGADPALGGLNLLASPLPLARKLEPVVEAEAAKGQLHFAPSAVIPATPRVVSGIVGVTSPTESQRMAAGATEEYRSAGRRRNSRDAWPAAFFTSPPSTARRGMSTSGKYTTVRTGDSAPSDFGGSYEGDALMEQAPLTITPGRLVRSRTLDDRGSGASATMSAAILQITGPPSTADAPLGAIASNSAGARMVRFAPLMNSGGDGSVTDAVHRGVEYSHAATGGSKRHTVRRQANDCGAPQPTPADLIYNAAAAAMMRNGVRVQLTPSASFTATLSPRRPVHAAHVATILQSARIVEDADEAVVAPSVLDAFESVPADSDTRAGDDAVHFHYSEGGSSPLRSTAAEAQGDKLSCVDALVAALSHREALLSRMLATLPRSAGNDAVPTSHVRGMSQRAPLFVESRVTDALGSDASPAGRHDFAANRDSQVAAREGHLSEIEQHTHEVSDFRVNERLPLIAGQDDVHHRTSTTDDFTVQQQSLSPASAAKVPLGDLRSDATAPIAPLPPLRAAARDQLLSPPPLSPGQRSERAAKPSATFVTATPQRVLVESVDMLPAQFAQHVATVPTRSLTAEVGVQASLLDLPSIGDRDVSSNHIDEDNMSQGSSAEPPSGKRQVTLNDAVQPSFSLQIGTRVAPTASYEVGTIHNATQTAPLVDDQQNKASLHNNSETTLRQISTWDGESAGIDAATAVVKARLQAAESARHSASQARTALAAAREVLAQVIASREAASTTSDGAFSASAAAVASAVQWDAEAVVRNVQATDASQRHITSLRVTDGAEVVITEHADTESESGHLKGTSLLRHRPGDMKTLSDASSRRRQAPVAVVVPHTRSWAGVIDATLPLLPLQRHVGAEAVPDAIRRSHNRARPSLLTERRLRALGFSTAQLLPPGRRNKMHGDESTSLATGRLATYPSYVVSPPHEQVPDSTDDSVPGKTHSRRTSLASLVAPKIPSPTASNIRRLLSSMNSNSTTLRDERQGLGIGIRSLAKSSTGSAGANAVIQGSATAAPRVASNRVVHSTREFDHMQQQERKLADAAGAMTAAFDAAQRSAAVLTSIVQSNTLQR